MTKEESLKKDIEKAIEDFETLSSSDAKTQWGEGYRDGLNHAINHLQFTLKLHEISKDFCDESNR